MIPLNLDEYTVVTDPEVLNVGDRFLAISDHMVTEGVFTGSRVNFDHPDSEMLVWEYVDFHTFYRPRQTLPTTPGSIVEGNGLRAVLTGDTDPTPWLIYLSSDSDSDSDSEFRSVFRSASRILELIGPDFKILHDEAEA